MNSEKHFTENLFSYGTLRQEEVQLATFGRRLEGRPDALVGYVLKMIEIRDQNFAAKNGAHQRNLQFTGIASDVVEGVTFAVTRQELEQADAYEPDDYERARVQLRSGHDAWSICRPSEMIRKKEGDHETFYFSPRPRVCVLACGSIRANGSRVSAGSKNYSGRVSTESKNYSGLQHADSAQGEGPG
jgi:hypothetical protein